MACLPPFARLFNVRTPRLIFATAAALMILSSQPIAGQTFDSGLAGHWKLDDGHGSVAADSSGNDNNGSLVGNPVWAAGRIDGSLQFSGSGEYVDTNKAIVQTTGDYSVAAWVLLNQLDNFRTAVSQDGVNVSGFFLQYMPGPNNGFAFSVVASDSTASPTTRALGHSAVSPGKWYHIVGVHIAASSQILLYVDGILVDTETTPSWSAMGSLVIGRALWGGGNTDYWPGNIEDVRVYNRILEADEIASLYLSAGSAAWQIGVAPLMTSWAGTVQPNNVLSEYPRPQLVRQQWMSLNGIWQLAAASPGGSPPGSAAFTEEILVPFPAESALSGVMRPLGQMWYRQSFVLPSSWSGQSVRLNVFVCRVAKRMTTTGTRLQRQVERLSGA
jgi:hypothetical protein